MRLIDADAANIISIKHYYKYNTHLSDVREWLDSQPTVDPQKHAIWIIEGDEDCLLPECSNCLSDALVLEGGIVHITKYCPNCGAKMDLMEETNE